VTASAAGKVLDKAARPEWDARALNTADLIAHYRARLGHPGLAPRQSAELWRSLARGLIQQNAHGEAIQALMEACQLDPENGEIFFDLGNLLFATANATAAVTAFRHAAGLSPDNAAVWHNLGNALATTGATTEALAAFGNACRLAPDDGGYLRALALNLLQTGDKAAARAAFARLVALDPGDGAAHLNLAGLQDFDSDDHRLAGMEARFADPATPSTSRIQFGFAMFRIFDAQKKHAKAFGYLDAANRLRRAALDFDAAVEEEVFAAFKRWFTRGFFEKHHGSGFADIAPIFIVGMPRSGTTLTEQILSSHSLVAAGGEATAMTDTVAAFLSSRYGQGLTLDGDAFSPARCLAMGQDYASRMRAIAGRTQHFTDKMPLNFRWVGIIAAILPEARFVHCTRDPLDTCFSIYSGYFASNGNRYGYDLAELGRYYRQYSSLMAHWHSVLPDKIIDMPLEGFVADQDAQTRRLLSFCGLEFEPACLDFHRNANRVTTMSAMQVRQPIYGGHSDKTAPYLPYLDPLRAALDGAA
jgi:Flp pilus assembly protein TadD